MRTSAPVARTAAMRIAIRRLDTCGALDALAGIQRSESHNHSEEQVPLSFLVLILKAGGVAFGAYDEAHEPALPVGFLLDLAGHRQERRSAYTVSHMVRADHRNRGIGYLLRTAERESWLEVGVGWISWGIDPLSGIDAHFAFNKLGALGAVYERHVLPGSVRVEGHGLAFDRIGVEWSIDSPRVRTVVDDGRLPAHYGIGLDRMEVTTETRAGRDGLRRLVGTASKVQGDVALVEIPVDLGRLLQADLPAARTWRIRSRDLLEDLFKNRFLLSGFVHEGGRSFLLLERMERDAALRRVE